MLVPTRDWNDPGLTGNLQLARTFSHSNFCSLVKSVTVLVLLFRFVYFQKRKYCHKAMLLVFCSGGPLILLSGTHLERATSILRL